MKKLTAALLASMSLFMVISCASKDSSEDYDYNYDYTQDAEFVTSRLVPYAREMLKFYDNFYGCNEQGKMVISPTQALETYWYDVVNDMPTIAGLHDVLPRLRALPVKFSENEDRELWQRLTEKLPDLPLIQTADGKTKFAPAELHEETRHNLESAELYPIFPFHLCNISTDNSQMGIDSYFNRISKVYHCWGYDGVLAARLGLTEEATQILLDHLTRCHHAFRLPVFWGEPMDWTPDQCHGGNFMITLQDMVLQTWDGKDYVLPAFPEDWGIKFKLHSVNGKVVKGNRELKSNRMPN